MWITCIDDAAFFTVCLSTAACVSQAAFLHDTVEDTDTSFDELEQVFGEEVKKVVAECSDDKALPKAERKRLQVKTENLG